MSRYCTISKCQKFCLNSLPKNIGQQQYKTVVDICLQSKNVKNSSSFWNKVVRNLSQYNGSNSVESDKVANSNDNLEKKTVNTKLLRKQLQKLCTNVQQSFTSKRTVLWSAAGLSVTENVTKNIEETSNPISSSSETSTELNFTGTKAEPIIEPIPEPPTIPEGVEDVANQLNALGEPTFASLGLGGWSPVGMVESSFEYLHCTLGIEWWAAIALATVVIRVCMFPLVIISQRNAARMNNYLPQMQLLQLKMTEARQTGNQLDAARYSQELMVFMKEKGLNPFKNMIVPLAQMPLFVSFFMGLRHMANVPVDSLRTGGMMWFTDLTLPDQYFLLPIITSATLFATIELGTDGAKLSAQNMHLMKYVLRGLPLVILPFTVNFPGAILCYWVSSNFISLLQVGFLKIPTVRDYFDIEQMRKFNPEDLPNKPKGFRQGLKESWENIKISKQLEERTRLDEINFKRSGKGPIVKTYKYDPTKQTEPNKSAPISAKNR